MPNDRPDWTRTVVIASGSVSDLLSTGTLNVLPPGHQDIPIPFLGGYAYYKLLISGIVAAGADCHLAMNVGTDVGGGAYQYQYLWPVQDNVQVTGGSTQFSLWRDDGTNSFVTAYRGDNNRNHMGMLDITIYNADQVDSGVAPFPPIGFWWRHIASKTTLALGDTEEGMGSYLGSHWSTDQFLRFSDPVGGPTSISGKWALIGYKYP